MMNARLVMTVVAGAAGVLGGCREKASEPASAVPAAVSSGGVTITSVSLENSGEFTHATIIAEIKNPFPRTLTAGPPDIRFRPSPDKSAEPFIAPGLDPVEIAAGAAATVATHWWFPARDWSAAARLEVGSAEIPVTLPGSR